MDTDAGRSFRRINLQLKNRTLEGYREKYITGYLSGLYLFQTF